MKTQHTGAHPAVAETALSLQEELVAAIHGAFEVAVEIAVREVKKLLGQTTGDHYEEMRRGNVSLKQRAEAVLNCAPTEAEGGGTAGLSKKQDFKVTKRIDRQLHLNFNPASPEPIESNMHRCTLGGGDAPAACNGRAQLHPDLQQHSSGDEQGSGNSGRVQYVRDDAACTKGM